MKTRLELKKVPKVQGSPQIGVFGRIPRAGWVKTRLTRAHDPAWVAGLYRAFLADTLETCGRVASDGLWLFLAPEGEADRGTRAQALLDLGARVRPEQRLGQQGQTLGARIADALLRMLARGPAIVVGSDAPDLPAGRLREAFVALLDHDLVLGPTADGGYYLIGTRAPVTDLLSGVEWSTPAVFEQTRARAAGKGWSTAVLAPWRDVDEPDDLDALHARLRGARAAGEPPPRHTAEWLRES